MDFNNSGRGNGKIPVLVIFAPTATGKTEVVGRLFSDNAPSFFAGKAEIVSCDSMQVYRGLNIGTAKPSSEFLAHLPHHLIDVCDADKKFGSGDFVALADEACKNIYSRGKIPVLCGGTAFYIKNFIFGLPITPESSPEVRLKIQNRLKEEGSVSLHKELLRVDSVSASKIHENDAYRICRALEVFYSSGKPLSSFQIPNECRNQYEFLTIYLTRSREELYERINSRVLSMFDEGLLWEVKSLIQSGFTKETSGMSAIGYREFFTSGENPVEMFELLDKNPDFAQTPRFLVWVSEIKRQIQRNTRHYAKKQITFFEPLMALSGNPANIHMIQADDFDSILNAIDYFLSLGDNQNNSH